MRHGTLLLCVLSACFSPTPLDGSLRCSPSGQPCPDGYYCAADLRCYMNGHVPDFGGDLALLDDALAPDASPTVDLAIDAAKPDDQAKPADLPLADLASTDLATNCPPCGPCMVCNVSGACSPMPAAAVDARCGSPSVCGATGRCDGLGACATVPAGTQCSDFTCYDYRVNMTIETKGLCNAGACSNNDPKCGAYLCYVDRNTNAYTCDVKCQCGTATQVCATGFSCVNCACPPAGCNGGPMYGVCQ